MSNFLKIWHKKRALTPNRQSPVQHTRGDYQIDNVGVQNVKIPGDSYADWGTFYLSPAQFEWGSSSLDIVGKKEARIKTTQKEVVTSVALNANGTLDVTTERVNVLG